MNSSIDSLSACTSPLATARVFNPTRSEYYLKDEVAAEQKAQASHPEAAVKVTLSEAAKAAMTGTE